MIYFKEKISKSLLPMLKQLDLAKYTSNIFFKTDVNKYIIHIPNLY